MRMTLNQLLVELDGFKVRGRCPAITVLLSFCEQSHCFPVLNEHATAAWLPPSSDTDSRPSVALPSLLLSIITL